jgi:hypothetical protein
MLNNSPPLNFCSLECLVLFTNLIKKLAAYITISQSQILDEKISQKMTYSVRTNSSVKLNAIISN